MQVSNGCSLLALLLYCGSLLVRDESVLRISVGFVGPCCPEPREDL